MKYLALVLFLVGCSESETPIHVQKCGNGSCDATETPTSCAADCATTATCGDGICGLGESMSCTQDCGSVVCGDGFCAPSEDMMSCAADCQSSGTCGDGLCAANESPENCVEDCGTCNNRCDGNDAHFCGDDGADVFISCPVDLGSACLSFDEGVSCDCGSLPDGEASCLDATASADLVECNGGGLEFFLCPVGTVCDDAQGVNCYCDNIADGICPGFCDNDVDCNTCTPNCDGKTCGDNGCEGECGTCAQGKSCEDATGTCTAVCVPNCTGKSCGNNGCGGMCGVCSGTQTCSTSGVCETPAPAKDLASWTVTLADGTSHNISFDENTPNAFFTCNVNTTNNTLDLEFSNGSDLVRMYIESDPIGFCLFNTSAFNTYTYQHYVNGSLDKTYGIASTGNTTMNLTLACSADAQRVDGTFSSGKLFENRSSSAFPGSYVTISNGVFDCAL